MKKIICSVMDMKLASHSRIVIFDNTAIAIRGFEDVCHDPESIFAKHPADFCLLKLGEVDCDTGVVENCDNIVLASATDFVR